MSRGEFTSIFSSSVRADEKRDSNCGPGKSNFDPFSLGGVINEENFPRKTQLVSLKDRLWRFGFGLHSLSSYEKINSLNLDLFGDLGFGRGSTRYPMEEGGRGHQEGSAATPFLPHV